jgi:hypothetical protein
MTKTRKVAMTKTLIKSIDDYGNVNGSFAFDDETWTHIGSDGTGSVGHYSTQGDRRLYASPKKSSKLGRHRFVLSGTGYYPAIQGGSIGNGGLNWNDRAVEVDEQTAFDIMDAKYMATYGKVTEELG